MQLCVFTWTVAPSFLPHSLLEARGQRKVRGEGLPYHLPFPFYLPFLGERDGWVTCRCFSFLIKYIAQDVITPSERGKLLLKTSLFLGAARRGCELSGTAAAAKGCLVCECLAAELWKWSPFIGGGITFQGDQHFIF